MDKTPIHVRFSDIDMAGNVHNSKYLRVCSVSEEYDDWVDET